jgi:hypothetical protein
MCDSPRHTPMCPNCGHPPHDGPCTLCAAENNTCWQAIRLTGGDGDRDAAGLIDMATTMEPHPCFACKSWEHTDTGRIIKHLASKGLKMGPDGKFETPIAKDFPGRVSLKIDPTTNGYCRRDCIITDALATCENWSPTRTISEFQQRMRKAG